MIDLALNLARVNSALFRCGLTSLGTPHRQMFTQHHSGDVTATEDY
jgi:hypothetical protein